MVVLNILRKQKLLYIKWIFLNKTPQEQGQDGCLGKIKTVTHLPQLSMVEFNAIKK